MADVHSKETRSYNMSRIKSKDTKPELLVRKVFIQGTISYIAISILSIATNTNPSINNLTASK